MREVQALFRADPGGYDALFAPNFLQAVPAAQLDALFKEVFTQYGRCVEATPAPADAGPGMFGPPGPTSGRYALRFERGDLGVADLAVEEMGGHRIAGLWLGPVRPANDSLETVVAEMKALPGACSFRLARLPAQPDGKPVVLAELDPERSLAIGSAFKLYVLAELCRAVAAGERHWEDVTRLEEGDRSLPSGQLQDWPAGSPVTLHTLAGLMISRSDNTATDALLHRLGRERVEAAVKASGHAHPQANAPFLSTLEASRLKYDPAGPGRRERYAKAVAADRRAMLAEPAFTGLDRAKLLPGTERPVAIDAVEWFASAADLCRVMDHLRRLTEAPAAAPGRAILAINPGLPGAMGTWAYAGFKGGSEPGVIQLTFLLRAGKADGGWLALSAGWNNPQAAVDEGRFTNLVGRALRVASER